MFYYLIEWGLVTSVKEYFVVCFGQSYGRSKYET